MLYSCRTASITGYCKLGSRIISERQDLRERQHVLLEVRDENKTPQRARLTVPSERVNGNQLSASGSASGTRVAHTYTSGERRWLCPHVRTLEPQAQAGEALRGWMKVRG